MSYLENTEEKDWVEASEAKQVEIASKQELARKWIVTLFYFDICLTLCLEGQRY